MFFKIVDTALSIVRNFFLANAIVFFVAPVTHKMISNILYDNYVYVREQTVDFFHKVKDEQFIREKVNKVCCKAEEYGYDIAYNILYCYTYAEHNLKKTFRFIRVYVNDNYTKCEEGYPFIKDVKKQITSVFTFIKSILYASIYDEIVDFETIYKEAFYGENKMNEDETEQYGYGLNISTVDFVKDGKTKLTLPVNIFIEGLLKNDTDNRMSDIDYDFVLYSDYENPNKDGSINKVIIHDISSSLTKESLSNYVIANNNIIMMECEFNEKYTMVDLKTRDYNYMIVGNILSDTFIYYFLRKHYGYTYDISKDISIMKGEGESEGEGEVESEKNTQGQMKMNFIDTSAASYFDMEYDFSKLFSNNPSILVCKEGIRWSSKL